MIISPKKRIKPEGFFNTNNASKAMDCSRVNISKKELCTTYNELRFNEKLLHDKSFRKSLSRRNLTGLVSFRSLSAKYNINPTYGLKNLFLKLSNFRIVIIGDSVIWGQGLTENEKTFNIVADFIRTKGNGLNVIIENYAHSGAIMGDKISRLVTTGKNSEVPYDFPTIFAQLDISEKKSTPDTDLIILNGGINDVGFTAIIDPVSDISEDSLRGETRKNCGAKMKQLLEETHHSHPNAQILVTGYFNMISINSNPVLYLALLSLFSASPGLLNELIVPVLLAFSIKRSKVFFEISQEALRNAVEEANHTINNKATFIKGDWSDEHALFASKSRLFGFGFDLSRFNFSDANPLTVVLEDNPAVAQARLIACMAEQGDFKCPIASVTSHIL